MVQIDLNNPSRISKCKIDRLDGYITVQINGKGYIEYNNLFMRPNIMYWISYNIRSVNPPFFFLNGRRINSANFVPPQKNNTLRIEFRGRDIITISKLYFFDSQLLNASIIVPDDIGTGKTLNSIFDHIYVINLRERPDRLDKVTRLLDSRDICYQVWQVDRHIDPEMGCLTSHKQVLQDAQRNNYHNPLILEDDVGLHTHLNIMLTNIPEDYDMLYLGFTVSPNGWTEFNLPSDILTCGKSKSRNCNGTFAYSVKGQDNIKYVLTVLDEGDEPVDKRLHKVQNEKNCISMIPNLIISDVKNSDIREPRNMDTYSQRVYWHLDNYEF